VPQAASSIPVVVVVAPLARYQLQHTARVHTGQSDESYGCMSWGPDPDGVNGVYLGKNVASEAGKALKMALTAITPKVRHSSCQVAEH
jgi:hypothetical protein